MTNASGISPPVIPCTTPNVQGNNTASSLLSGIYITTNEDVTHPTNDSRIWTNDTNTPNLLSESLMSEESLSVFESVTYYLVNPLLILGFFFCLFGIVVYSSKQMRSPTSIYFVALHMTELTNVIILMIEDFYILGYGTGVKETLAFVAIHTYMNVYAGTCIRRTTYCLSCLLSVERCIAVVFPLKSKHFKVVRYPLQTIILVTVSSFIFHLFVVMKFYPASYISPTTNDTVWTIRFGELFLKDPEGHNAWSFYSKIIYVVVPLLACLIFNLITVIALQKHRKAREQLTAGGRKNNDVRTTITVLVATMVLVLSALPANGAAFMINVNRELYDKEYYFFHMFIRLGRLTELTNNCLAFIFYMTLSSIFRKTFLTMFCFRCKRKSHNSMDPTAVGSTDTYLSDVSMNKTNAT